MSYKDTNISNPGTSIKYGADDMEVIARLFNGVTTGVHPVTVKSSNKWGFWDNILYFRNQADSRNTTIRGQSNVPSTDVTLTLPPIPNNDVLPAIGISQIWALKQQYDSGIVLNQMSTPSAPGAGLHQVYVGSNGHLLKTDNALVTKDYDTTAQVVPIEVEDGVLALRDYVRVCKVGSTYFAIGPDSATISSNTNPATVIQAALDIAEGKMVWIDTASTGWDFQAGFTGLSVGSWQTIYITGNSNFYMPNGYTGAVFKITGSVNHTTIWSDGCYFNELGSVAKNWIGIQIGAGDATDAIHDITIRGIKCYQCDAAVKINQGSTGFIEQVVIESVSPEDFKKLIWWNVSDATKVEDVVVRDCRPVALNGTTTDIFKDVKGERTTFYSNTLRGMTGSMNEMSIASGAIGTMVFGGNHTGSAGTFTDAGTNTYIDDALHTEFKLKGTAVTASAISSIQHDYSPTGWDEKQNNLRVSATGGTQTITGLVCGPNPKNRITRISNVGATDTIILASENAGSTAANRFKFFGDVTVLPNQAILLFYSSDDSRWRALSDVSAVGVFANAANTFTQVQTIQPSSNDALVLYRPVSSIGDNIDINVDFQNAIAERLTYGEVRIQIADNTDGNEDADFRVNLMASGTRETVLKMTSAGVLDLFNPVSTVGAQTEIRFRGKDSLGSGTDYGMVNTEIVDNTDGSEDGDMEFATILAGSLTNKMILRNTGTLDLGTVGSTGKMTIQKDASADFMEFYRTDNSGNIELSFYLQDSGAAKQIYAQILANVHSNTAGAETGRIGFNLVKAGTIQNTHTFYSDGSMELYNFANVDNDVVELNFYLNDSSNNKTRYGTMECFADDTGNGSEDGSLWYKLMRAGTEQYVFAVRNSGNISCGRDVNFQRFIPSIIVSGSGGGATNTGTETTWFSFTIKANTMGSNGSVAVKCAGVITQNSATATNYHIRVKVGGTTIWSENLGGALTQSGTGRPFMLDMDFVNVGSTNSNRVYLTAWLNDTAAPVTGEGSATDDETQAQAFCKSFVQSFDTTGDLTFLVSVDMDQTQTNSGWDGHWHRATLYPST